MLQQQAVQNYCMPGVAVGLAWTYVGGGDILFVETSLSEGKGELKLTGNLGNVMKESAVTALACQSNARKLNIDPAILKELHVHVRCCTKDGPSAGTIMTATAQH